ncbi:translational GTPase TypA [Tuberibacillus sp. Marseille-P3662]|uniref:translational GTPase TypA n=1 Tax=Tuberibacillus sp. Marseille-P3662 TaxID=1965358 RepID=UPI000A1C8500|nr:translational GTPase TypA [Tuberibacillus sp. Marseille-P3662]
MTETRNHLRNIAIIAHVDHGKTTLVDQMLHQSGTFRKNEHVQERAMDRNDLERERGITILSKNTSIDYKDYRVNIVDTPGHADFSGEVERIMKMADGVLLVVDAYEGVMPQTRFVLKKALDQKLQPIVVVNKIDKPMARPEEVVDEVLELFIDLGADDDQLDFPVVYASAIEGVAGEDYNDVTHSMDVLFDKILKYMPAPKDNSDEPLQFQVTMLDYNDYVGRIGVGRVYRGKIKVGQQAALAKTDGSVKQFRVTKIFGFVGLKRVEIEEAKAGDLIAISGVEDINIGETICDAGEVEPLPLLKIDKPTLQMNFLTNSSPFAGREGDYITSRKVQERLFAETERDVSLNVEKTESPDEWVVSGRGELHLSILIENMRREGYELQVSKPTVIQKEEEGVIKEPYERMFAEVPQEHTGGVIESIGMRKGEMLNMEQMADGHNKLEFIVPSRGLIGYRRDFLTETRGYGVMNHTFDHYGDRITEYIGGRRAGVLVAMEKGQSTTYAMMQLEDRGVMFIEPGTEVYEGMIVGEHTRENDLTVNVTKAKQMTNVRSATKDQTATVKGSRTMSLEDALAYLNDDEYCEITPVHFRLRKKILDKNERERLSKKKKQS